jgi:hypothetical protein
MLFEAPHAAAQRWLSNSQPLCCATKVERFSDHQKSLNLGHGERVDHH